MGKEAKQRTAGLRSFTVTTAAGRKYSFDLTKTAPTVVTSGAMREVKESSTTDFAGTKETRTSGKIVAEVFDRGNVRMADINDWDDVTAILVLASGKSFTCNGASTEKPELDAAEGTYSITIEGKCFEETYE